MRTHTIYMVLLLICGVVTDRFTPERPLTKTEQNQFQQLITTKLPRLIGKDVTGFKFISIRTQEDDGNKCTVLVRLSDTDCISVKILRRRDEELRITEAQPCQCPNKSEDENWEGLDSYLS
ncbi:unnamed protein product [Calicophoron daubneyi]|uniref:Uncharacterized protein n=1 Tax=Calicophoron daubneyi TaxID=300641 RepID=A0AAV2TL68_CALDB